jgi:hypothetical protein
MHRKAVEVGVKRKTIGRLGALAVSGALMFMALPVSSASAGSNGQQLAVCAPDWAATAYITGVNQDGAFSQLTMGVIPGECDYNTTLDWWWKGQVDTYFAGPGSNLFYSYHSCWVSAWQRDNDFYTC